MRNHAAALPFLLATFLASAAGAQTGAPPAASGAQGLTRPGEARAGSLLLASAGTGLYRIAPVADTDVVMRVTGLVARVTVEQRFWNPSADWVEGLYVFPLPENAAVDTLTMTIGTRRIEGEVREREAARQAYEQARAEGRKASLLEEARPNLFTTAVANLGPNEAVVVRIEYQQELRYDGKRFSLRFPLVVAPRYSPPVAGAEAVPGPESNVAGDAAVQPVSLRVELAPGFDLRRLESPSHEVRITETSRRGRRVTLAREVVPADRDFVLEWEPDLSRQPGAGLFSEEAGGEKFALLMLLPPQLDRAAYRPEPREVILVLDTSGSMGGPSIDQAKSALYRSLELLRPEDSFNLVTFSDNATRLFASAVPASPENLELARRAVERIEANGGTEMRKALTVALDEPAAAARLRQVVFITDGEVTNEEELFSYIHAQLGGSRLFTVGIGSAPNTFFMTKAAEEGRGTFTYVGKLDEVAAKMDALFAKLSLPVLTDVELDWGGVAAEMFPARVPDLYAGEPIVVAARLSAIPAAFRVRGKTGGELWEMELPTGPVQGGSGQSGAGLDKLWARRKIDALETAAATHLEDTVDPEEAKQAIVEVALAHHLVSRHTSLVAVDVTPTAPAGTELVARKVPVALPAGWAGDDPEGALPQGATSWQLDLLLGLALAAAAGLAWRLAKGGR